MARAEIPIRLLYLDDSVSDASIVQLALENAGSQINVSLRHVRTWQDFLLALENESFDLILSILSAEVKLLHFSTNSQNP